MNEPTRDELISAYLDGEVDARQRAQVERWLRDDPEARRLLEELKAVGQSLRALPRESLPDDFADRVLARAEREMLFAPSESDRLGSSDQPLAAPQRSQRTVPWQRVQRPLIYMLVTLAAAVLVMVWDQRPADSPDPTQLAQHLPSNSESDRQAADGASRRDEPLDAQWRARAVPSAERSDRPAVSSAANGDSPRLEKHPVLPKAARSADSARPPVDSRRSMSRGASPAPPDGEGRSSEPPRAAALGKAAPVSKAAPPNAIKASPPTALDNAPSGGATSARSRMIPSPVPESASESVSDADADRRSRKSTPPSDRPLPDTLHQSLIDRPVAVVVVRSAEGPFADERLSKTFARADIVLELPESASSRGPRPALSGPSPFETNQALAPASPADRSEQKPDARSDEAKAPREDDIPPQPVQVVYVEARHEQLQQLLDALRAERDLSLHILPDPNTRDKQPAWFRSSDEQRTDDEAKDTASDDDAASAAAMPSIDRQRLLRLVDLWFAPPRNRRAETATVEQAPQAEASSHSTGRAWRLPVQLTPNELLADTAPSNDRTVAGRAADSRSKQREGRAMIQQRRDLPSSSDSNAPAEPKPRAVPLAENKAAQSAPAAASPSSATTPRSSPPLRALFVFLTDKVAAGPAPAERHAPSAPSSNTPRPDAPNSPEPPAAD